MQIIDARTMEEFVGFDGDREISHLPASNNMDWTDLMKKDDTIRSLKDIANLFNECHIDTNRRALLYCSDPFQRHSLFVLFCMELLDADLEKVFLFNGNL